MKWVKRNASSTMMDNFKECEQYSLFALQHTLDDFNTGRIVVHFLCTNLDFMRELPGDGNSIQVESNLSGAEVRIKISYS